MCTCCWIHFVFLYDSHDRHLYGFAFHLRSINCKFLCLIIRFVQYKPTSLEKNYKHEMLTEVDLGVNIDLIDPDTYALDPNGEYLIYTNVYCFRLFLFYISSSKTPSCSTIYWFLHRYQLIDDFITNDVYHIVLLCKLFNAWICIRPKEVFFHLTLRVTLH